jgi:hypothetical protein
VLNARPSRRRGRGERIVIADDKVLPAVQHRKKLIAIPAARRHEVAEMPDVVFLSHGRIPVPD